MKLIGKHFHLFYVFELCIYWLSWTRKLAWNIYFVTYFNSLNIQSGGKLTTFKIIKRDHVDTYIIFLNEVEGHLEDSLIVIWVPKLSSIKRRIACTRGSLKSFQFLFSWMVILAIQSATQFCSRWTCPILTFQYLLIIILHLAIISLRWLTGSSSRHFNLSYSPLRVNLYFRLPVSFIPTPFHAI